MPTDKQKKTKEKQLRFMKKGQKITKKIPHKVRKAASLEGALEKKAAKGRKKHGKALTVDEHVQKHKVLRAGNKITKRLRKKKKRR